MIGKPTTHDKKYAPCDSNVVVQYDIDTGKGKERDFAMMACGRPTRQRVDGVPCCEACYKKIWGQDGTL